MWQLRPEPAAFALVSLPHIEDADRSYWVEPSKNRPILSLNLFVFQLNKSSMKCLLKFI